MNIKEYQTSTHATSVYPFEHELQCLALGIMEEAGECSGVRKKLYRGDYGEAEYLAKLSKELGDCMWYLSEISNATGISMETLVNIRELEIGIEKAFIELARGACMLADEVVNFQNVVVSGRIRISIAFVISVIKTIIQGNGLHFESVLQQNIDKLRARQMANNLKGQHTDE